MPAFKIRWFKNEPISETVGNGLCAVPGAWQIEPMQLNGITHRRACRGGNLPPGTLQLLSRIGQNDIPFNHTGYIRNVAGGSRPYRRCTSAPVVPTMLNAVLRLIHRLWRSPFPEGEGFGADLHAVPENRSPKSTVQKLPLGEAGRA